MIYVFFIRTLDTVLRQSRWLSTAWDLANLYLAGFDKALLSEQGPLLAGLSEETTSYLSVHYFHTEDTFEGFLVHEAAHVFHNCKRETIGLRKIRGREWLLEIDFTKRELFAYACPISNGRPVKSMFRSFIPHSPLRQAPNTPRTIASYSSNAIPPSIFYGRTRR